MKNHLSLFIAFLALNALSCSQEDEMDKAIEEAMNDASFENQELDEDISLRYYIETKAR